MKKMNLMQCFESNPCSPRRHSWIGLTVCTLLGMATSVSSAQTPQSDATATFKQLDRFEKTLEAIQSGEPLDEPTPISPVSRLTKPAIDEKNPKPYPNVERIDSIHERINLLKRLIEDERNTAESVQPPSKPVSNLPDMVRTDDASEADTDNPSIESGMTSEPVQPSESPDISESTQPLANGQGSGIPVLGEPVNSFELANSLFLTGNISAARKSYEARLKEDASPEDEAWLRCLVGCCYRQEGNFAKAEEVFRDVTNLKLNSYPVEHSNWCLQYVAKRRVSYDQLLAIESEIDSVLTKAGKK